MLLSATAGMAVLVLLDLVITPSGLSAWVMDLVIWAITFALFIGGYWAFTSKNQALQRDPNYITEVSQPVKFRMAYLAVGFVLNIIAAWPLADELSRVWFS
jgi:hypothetical protein